MLYDITIIIWSCLLCMSGLYFVFAWNKECKAIKKAILHLLFTNTVFQFYILIIILKIAME